MVDINDNTSNKGKISLLRCDFEPNQPWTKVNKCAN